MAVSSPAQVFNLYREGRRPPRTLNLDPATYITAV